MPQNYTGSISAAYLSPQARKAAGTARKGLQIDLKSVDQLKDAFQRDGGKVRLVTILSPT
jgi:hypothetical protein